MKGRNRSLAPKRSSLPEHLKAPATPPPSERSFATVQTQEPLGPREAEGEGRGAEGGRVAAGSASDGKTSRGQPEVSESLPQPDPCPSLRPPPSEGTHSYSFLGCPSAASLSKPEWYERHSNPPPHADRACATAVRPAPSLPLQATCPGGAPRGRTARPPQRLPALPARTPLPKATRAAPTCCRHSPDEFPDFPDVAGAKVYTSGHLWEERDFPRAESERNKTGAPTAERTHRPRGLGQARERVCLGLLA